MIADVMSHGAGTRTSAPRAGRNSGGQTGRFERYHILVIDDDEGTCENARAALQLEGFQVSTARSGAIGLSVVRSTLPDLLIVDFRLPDMTGIDFVRTLQNEGRKIRFVVISGFLTTSATVEAMQLGALNVVDKPILIDELVTLVRLACHVPDASPFPARLPAPISPPRSVAERWAVYVLRGCESDGDLKTLEGWAGYIGVSCSSLCETCRLLSIRPHDARDFTRVLRAVIRASADNCVPEVLLDVRDRRTLRILLKRSGLETGAAAMYRSVGELLEHQQFIDRNNQGFRVLQHIFENRSTGGGV